MDGESYIRRMENDNRFALDARLGDLVVCLSWTDMSDDEIISVCLYLKPFGLFPPDDLSGVR